MHKAVNTIAKIIMLNARPMITPIGMSLLNLCIKTLHKIIPMIARVKIVSKTTKNIFFELIFYTNLSYDVILCVSIYYI